MSLFVVYKTLWKRIEAEGVWVHYSGLAADEGGYFAHAGCGKLKKPEIMISRKGYGEPQDDPSELLGNGQPANVKDELLTLAHEYGHYLSWKGETPQELWADYHAAAFRRDGVVNEVGWQRVPSVLSAQEKQLISDEETLAWNIGRPFIPEELLPEYGEKARRGVHNHRYRLGLDELWPEDA